MKVRPKTFVIYRIATFTGDAVCYIHCYPQQKWVLTGIDNGKAKLERRNVSLVIPKEEFEKHWIEV